MMTLVIISDNTSTTAWFQIITRYNNLVILYEWGAIFPRENRLIFLEFYRFFMSCFHLIQYDMWL